MAWMMQWLLVKSHGSCRCFHQFLLFLCSSVTQLVEREDVVFDFLLPTTKSINPEHDAKVTGTKQYKYY